jgi:MFS family permease
MNLSGCFLLGIFILASGLARIGLELIIFRAFQGIAISMCFPTSFSILTDAFPNGRRRNIAFASLGLVQPLGWSVGLFLGGFLDETSLGWRFGFYLCAGGCIILACINCWMLPKDLKREPFSWMKLRRGIDWVGIILSSACLGILSYVLA